MKLPEIPPNSGNAGLGSLEPGGTAPEFNPEDLLGRAPIELDLAAVRRLLRGRTVMVTGGAGSIGSELCAQILTFEPKALLCVDRDETALFQLEHSLSRNILDTSVLYCLEDMGDTGHMRKLMIEHRVDFIFHAAAYKHVPLMERNPRNAVQNNISALRRLVDAAEASGVEAFLLISSDKAVHPANVMGCTKRVGELILSANANRRMRCVSVRFGNVLGSKGSVVPIFLQQIRERKPITVTHPEATRFFMTLSEAVSLVLQAFSIGRHGDILVLDMGNPVSILGIAERLRRATNGSGEETPIVFTGLRPGEKLHEELFYSSERKLATECDTVLRAEGRILNWVELERRVGKLERILAEASESEIKRALAEIVPEYEIRGEKGTLRPELTSTMPAL